MKQSTKENLLGAIALFLIVFGVGAMDYLLKLSGVWKMDTIVEKMNMRIIYDESEEGYHGIGSNCKSIEAASDAIIDALHEADIFHADEPHGINDITYTNEDVLLLAETLIDFGSAMDNRVFTKAVCFLGCSTIYHGTDYFKTI